MFSSDINPFNMFNNIDPGIAGSADLIDVLLKYGLVDMGTAKEMSNILIPQFLELMNESPKYNGEIAHFIDVVMARAMYTPKEFNELMKL